MGQALRPTADPAWLLSEVGYDPLRESSFETRFAISNGFLGLRGALATDLGACRTLPPRTYVAGLFDTALVGAPIPERLPAPDWLKLRIGLPDGPYLACPDPSSRDVTLDMRRGLLLTQVRQPPGAALDIRLSTLRLVSLDMRGIVLQLVELAVERGMGEITLDVTSGEASPLLTPVTAEPDLGVWRTRQSRKGPRHRHGRGGGHRWTDVSSHRPNRRQMVLEPARPGRPDRRAPTHPRRDARRRTRN